MKPDQFEGVCCGCRNDGDVARLKIMASDGAPCCSARCADTHDDWLKQHEETERHNACGSMAPDDSTNGGW